MKFVIDSSVLFDLYHGNVLEDFVETGIEFFVPDIIQRELITPNWEYFSKFGIHRESLPGKCIIEIYELRKQYKDSTTIDLFALVLAKKKKVDFLTCDKNLRKAGEENGLIVHGSIWVLDFLVERKKITKKKAYNALQKMLDNQSRLPEDEVGFRLEMWGGTK